MVLGRPDTTSLRRISVESVPVFKRRMPPAVILAAGAGSRMRAGGDGPPKPLTRLLEYTLLERSMRSCTAAGVDEFIIVVGHQRATVGAHARELALRVGATRLQVVVNWRWPLGNGASALASEPYVDGPFFLIMGDHLFPPRFLERLHERDDGPRSCALIVDKDVGGVRDLPGATKVRLAGGKIAAIGKRLGSFDAVDTGVFLFRRPLFDALREAGATGDHSLSAAVRLLADRGQASAVPSGGLFWQDVDTPDDLAFARYSLEMADIGPRGALPG